MFILCLKFVEQFTYPFSWWICNFVILQERKCMYKLLGNNCSLILSGVPCLNWNKGTDIPYQFISLGGMKYFQLYSRFQINWKLEKHNKEKLIIKYQIATRINIYNLNYNSGTKRRANIILIIRALEGRNVWNTQSHDLQYDNWWRRHK